MRHTRKELSPQVSEGSSILILSDRQRPRILKFTDYGESGRSEKKVFLLDSLNFMVWRTELLYDRSVSAQRSPAVASARFNVYVVCAGTPVADPDGEASDVLARVAAALRRPVQKH